MKFLIDMPASPKLVPWLAERGHDALHAQEAGLRAASDSDILNYARSNDRVIITVDLDFGGCWQWPEQKGRG